MEVLISNAWFCARVINYKCFKTLLTTKCGMPKEEVEKNDETHFNFWNDLEVPDIPGKCNGNSQDSIKHCKVNDVSDGTTTPTTTTTTTTTTTPSDNFESVIEKCIDKVGYNNQDYLNCYTRLFNKTEITDPNDTKISCCNRMVQFQCWKEILTSKCSVSEDQVKKNDDVHYNYWNNKEYADKPEKCSGGKDELLELCKLKSGVSKFTWSITLQLAGIFVMYLFGRF